MSEAKQYLLAGNDGGSSAGKISYIGRDGKVHDISIPTIIAKDDPNGINLGKMKSSHLTDNLRVEINGNEFIGRGFYLVGSAAKLAPRENRIEAKDNINKYESRVHIITMIVGEALAALENGMEGTVYIPPSTGLPIDFIKENRSTEFLTRLKGVFEVSFLDGLYTGRKITIVHDVLPNAPAELYVYGESTKARQGLSFDVVDFELTVNPIAHVIGDPEEPMIVTDPGGVTIDVSVFETDGINGLLSKSYFETPEEFKNNPLTAGLYGKKVGANDYIEQVENAANNKIREKLEEAGEDMVTSTSFFRSRNELIEKVLKPYTDKLFAKEDNPRITVKASGVDVDLTDTIVPILDEYGMILYRINRLAQMQEGAMDIDKNVMCGGGVLLAYKILRDNQKNKLGQNRYELPDDIYASPFANSRGYLFESYINHEDIVQAMIKQFRNPKTTKVRS